MVLDRIEFTYNVSAQRSTLLCPFEKVFRYRPQYPLYIIHSGSKDCRWLGWHWEIKSFPNIKEVSRIHDSIRARLKRIKINSDKKEESRLDGLFPGWLVMRRNLTFCNWNWVLLCILFDEFNVRQWLSESYASWRSTIRITQKEQENLHCDVDRWIMSFEKWFRTAESEDITSILDESGSSYGRVKVKDLAPNEGPA